MIIKPQNPHKAFGSMAGELVVLSAEALKRDLNSIDFLQLKLRQSEISFTPNIEIHLFKGEYSLGACLGVVYDMYDMISSSWCKC